MTTLEKLIRTIGCGIGGFISGGAIATICEKLAHNESLVEALTKKETMYFAGAWAIGTALYQANKEFFKNKNEEYN